MSDTPEVSTALFHARIVRHYRDVIVGGMCEPVELLALWTATPAHLRDALWEAMAIEYIATLDDLHRYMPD